MNRWRLSLLSLVTIANLSACYYPGEKVPRPAGWEPFSTRYFWQCPEIVGAYHFMGDIHTKDGLKRGVDHMRILFERRLLMTGFWDLERVTHVRILRDTDGDLVVSAMNRDKPVASNKVRESCWFRTIKLTLQDSVVEVEVGVDGAIYHHVDELDCVFPLCTSKETWSRWAPYTTRANGNDGETSIAVETDSRDFFESGCPRGDLRGCRTYLNTYASGEFRERATRILQAATDSRSKSDEVFSKGSHARMQDCSLCPYLMPIPSGQFNMGAKKQANDPALSPYRNELPQHPVQVRGFYMGATAVTAREWAACVGEGACEFVSGIGDFKASDVDLPFLGITTKSASEYVEWLRKKTGLNYRIPSEAEWEYAARGGTSSSYYWGEKFKQGRARVEEPSVDRPTSVAQYPPNPFGLYDMGGNGYELTADCWHPDYEFAPDETYPWRTDNFGDCRYNVIRGSWNGSVWGMRVTTRLPENGAPRHRIGLRVVRD